jgi:hypothetical protein
MFRKDEPGSQLLEYLVQEEKDMELRITSSLDWLMTYTFRD